MNSIKTMSGSNKDLQKYDAYKSRGMIFRNTDNGREVKLVVSLVDSFRRYLGVRHFCVQDYQDAANQALLEILEASKNQEAIDTKLLIARVGNRARYHHRNKTVKEDVIESDSAKGACYTPNQHSSEDVLNATLSASGYCHNDVIHDIQLDELLEKLSVGGKSAAILLAASQGYSYKDIAKQHNITQDVVKHSITDARKQYKLTGQL